VVFSNEVFSTFTAMSSRTLLSGHVILRRSIWYYGDPSTCILEEIRSGRRSLVVGNAGSGLLL